jgi:hypothetical protein
LDGKDDRYLNAVDVSRDRKMDGNRANRNCVRRDQMMGGNLVGNHDLRMNGLHLDVTDASRGHHMSDQLGDRMTDGNHDRRKNDLHLDAKGDRNLSAVDESRGHHMSDLHLGEKILDVNQYCHRVIRKCALHVKNYQCHRVDLSIDPECYDLNMNCDQLSRDHLQCDHRKLRHRGKNLNLDAKNLGVKMRIDPECCDLKHLNHARMNYRGNPMKVCQRMDAKDASQMRNYGHLDGPVNGTMNYLQAWLLLFLKLGESDRYSVMFLKYRKVSIIKQIWN